MASHSNAKEWRNKFSNAEQAEAYARARPGYPEAVFSCVLAYLEDSPRQTCLDLATGSGQAAYAWANHFDRVVALDQSLQQLQNARQHTKVSYQHANAESTGLPDSSMDLVTSATGLHWTNLEATYKEAARVLKPGGAVAFFSYSDVHILENVGANDVFQSYFHGLLEPYWEPRLKICWDGYVDVHPTGFIDEQRPGPFQNSRQVDLQGLRGMIRSTSGYNTYREQQGDAEARSTLDDMIARMAQALGQPEAEVLVTTDWPVHLVLARKAAAP